MKNNIVESTKAAGMIIPEVEGLPTIARYAAGGGMVGGGAAALISLLHRIRMEKKLNKDYAKLQKPHTDENTIVLDLPRKIAAIKEANDPATFAYSMLAALGGGLGSAALVRKLYHKKLLRDIKDREDAARHSVIRNLSSPVEKTAKRDTFGPLDLPLGSALMLTLLGTGATAYITKQILDSKFKTRDRKGFEDPQINSIRIRQSPLPADTEVEKEASFDEIDSIRTLTVLHMVKLGGDTGIFEDEAVKEAMVKEGATREGLLDLTERPSMQKALSELMGQKDVRRTLQGAYMNDHPILKYFKWALKVPGLSNIADKMTSSQFGIHPTQKAQASGSGGTQPWGQFNKYKGKAQSALATGGDMFANSLQNAFSSGIPGVPGSRVPAALYGAYSGYKNRGVKAAAFGINAPGVANSLFGSMLADKTDIDGPVPVKLEQPIEESSPQEMVNRISISGDDPVTAAKAVEMEPALRELIMRILVEHQSA